MIVLLGLTVGALAACGMWLIVAGARVQPRRLVDAIAAAHRPPPRHPSSDSRSARWAAVLVASERTPQLQADLDVLDRPLERYATTKLTMLAAFASLPVGMWLVMASGGVFVPVTVPVVGALIGGMIGYVLPRRLLASEAASARRDFGASLGAYLDVVTIELAGGAAIEGALWHAARVGVTRPIGQLRDALALARRRSESPWYALRRLGDDLGVTELRDLCASIELAGEAGAAVRESLVAKAHSLREHQFAYALASAEANSERMAVPSVLMLVAFILLIGYPAMVRVMQL
ncbi:MAG: hypothetical protein M3Q30_10400 [Actinomycetota bacterium]|nr:hypothetical protein [Actinomycetota bacterium]